MNISRHSSCSFQQKYVYLFNGWIDGKRSEKVFRLDCVSDGAEWEPLAGYPVEPSFERRVCAGIIQSDRNTLSIFGGFGKSAAQKDYWDIQSNLDGEVSERRKVAYTR